MTHNETRISNERLAEMLAGLEGLPPGPYWAGDNEADLIDGKGRWLNPDHGDPFWHHVARCDPDTIRALILEMQELRTPVEAEPVAYVHPHGAIWRSDNCPYDIDFTKDGWAPLYPLPNPSPSDGEVDTLRAALKEIRTETKALNGTGWAFHEIDRIATAALKSSKRGQP